MVIVKESILQKTIISTTEILVPMRIYFDVCFEFVIFLFFWGSSYFSGCIHAFTCPYMLQTFGLVYAFFGAGNWIPNLGKP